jgi:hypothetical protein
VGDNKGDYLECSSAYLLAGQYQQRYVIVPLRINPCSAAVQLPKPALKIKKKRNYLTKTENNINIYF